MDKSLKTAQSLSDEYEVALVYGDLHLPSADTQKLSILISIIEDLKPDMIIDGGDFLDGNSISAYKKSYDQLASLQDELDIWFSWARRVEKVAGKARKIILKDNHFCRRLDDIFCDAYWASKLTALSPSNLLELDKFKWELLNEYLWKDNLLFVHGDGAGGGTSRLPVNRVRTLVRETGYSTVKFHTHSTGIEIIEQTQNDKIAVQIGTFQSIDRATYIKHPKLSNWSTSAGVFYLSKKDRTFLYTPILFMNGRTVLNNKVYSV